MSEDCKISPPINIYPATFESKMGFDLVRRMVRERCSSAIGRFHVDQMSFSTDFDCVNSLLNETAEMLRAIHEENPIPLNFVADDINWLAALRVPGTYADEAHLVQLRRSLATAAAVDLFFKKHTTDDGVCDLPYLSDAAKPVDGCRPVTMAINAVLDDNGQVRDNASPDLRDIRMRLSQIGGRISAAMRRVVANGIRDGILDPDTSPSIRNGRLVIPVAPMNKRGINGIVHDESASGKTCFIEPAEVVELNNRQRELESEERREVIRILTVTTDSIRPYIDCLINTCETLGLLDFIAAKARFADFSGGALPHLHKGPHLEWYTACHPVLKATLEQQNRRVVPLDIQLTKDARIIIISGPNAGGKSVTLKTVGIIQYMAQCGILPTLYENSHIGIFDSIFVDIGDDQSLENDLSTYSSHLRNMKHFSTRGDRRSLILIDEFGSGTEPQIGGALAQALLGRFNSLEMWGIITTHYQNIKTFADETPGLVNASMLYDRQKMTPLFKLTIGHPGSSFAIEIARKTGLPEDIIEEAKRIVGSDYVNLDKYLLDIARDRRYWENKRDRIRQREKHLDDVIERYENEAETLRANRRAIIAEARTQAADIIAGSNAAIERTIHDIRRSQADREATAEARRKLSEEKAKLSPEHGDKTDERSTPELLRRAPKPKRQKPTTKPKESEPIAIGDNVILDGNGSVGTVMAIEGKKASVAFGALKLSVEISRLSKTLKKAQSGAKAATFVSAQTTDSIRDRQLKFSTEIDVRGMRADEAVQAVTYYIDDALQFNTRRVRILHGTGTGALRTYIRQYLATVPGVISFHDEDVRFGGAGITVVEM